MEAMKTKEGYYDRSDVLALGDAEIHYRRVLPCKAKTWMALDLAEAALVFDEDAGIVYEGYTYEVVLVVLMMKYYTDLDLSTFEGEEGWYQLYDLLESHGALDALYGMLAPDLGQVEKIYRHIKDAAAATFEKQHSLAHKVMKSFGSLLGDEDLMTSVAKAEGINSRMIDMLAAFQQKPQTPGQMARAGMIPFAKRDMKKEPPFQRNSHP